MEVPNLKENVIFDELSSSSVNKMQFSGLALPLARFLINVFFSLSINNCFI